MYNIKLTAAFLIIVVASATSMLISGHKIQENNSISQTQQFISTRSYEFDFQILQDLVSIPPETLKEPQTSHWILEMFDDRLRVQD